MNTARNKGKICVSVCAETADEAIADIKGAEELADVIEVRFDCLSTGALGPFRSQISNLKFQKPLIATLRSPKQGGRNDATPEERTAFWSEPLPKFWAADVEQDVVDAAGVWPFRIVSYHDHADRRSELAEVFDLLSKCGPSAVKIAVQANDSVDGIAVWRLLDAAISQNKLMIPIAMGEAGKWTRILGLAHGAYLTYASLDEGKETAEGQITAQDLRNVYRVKELDRDTKVYGVIGDPVSESLSPYIHNAAFADARLNAVFIPLLVKDVDEFFKRMVVPTTREVELNFAGFAVTMPHKQAVMKYFDHIDETARKIGAVNTIKIDDDGTLTGYNTDAQGFIGPLTTKFGDLKGAKVAILGAGGAARACAYSLMHENVDATIFARNVNKAEALAYEFGLAAEEISNLKSEISNFEVLVNATPLGMKGDFENVSPLTADELKGVNLIFDLVTSSTDTPLIHEAAKAGVETIAGIDMLIEQGARQFEIWTGREAPRDVMRTAAEARMEKLK